MTNYGTCTATKYNTCAMANNDKCTMTTYNTYTMTYYGKCTMTNYDKCTMTNYDKCTMTKCDKCTMTNYDKCTMTSVRWQSAISVRWQTTINVRWQTTPMRQNGLHWAYGNLILLGALKKTNTANTANCHRYGHIWTDGSVPRPIIRDWMFAASSSSSLHADCDVSLVRSTGVIGASVPYFQSPPDG